MAQTKAQLLNPLAGQLNLSGIVTSSGFKVGSGVSIVGAGVKATSFYGDGSALTGITSGPSLSAGSGSQRVVLTGQTSGSMTAAATDAELTYNSGTDTLSAGTFSGALSGNASGTAGGLSGTPDITIRNLTGVAATFTGVLTYEDVTNVDSVGVITARAGIKFGLAGVGGTITADGHAEFVGMCTANGVTSDGVITARSGIKFGLAGVGGTITADGHSEFVGLITARSGIKFGLAGVGGTITADGHAEFVGVCTASSFDGRVPQIPQNVQGGTYTLVNSDAGKHINAGGNVTVNSGIFAIGDAISVFNDTGGDITIIQGSSVTLRLVADTGTGTRTLANYGLACILCVGSNEFVVSGGGVT